MRQIGVAVLERARALPDGVDDLAAREHRADRLIAAAQSLGDRLDVGRDALLLPGVQRAGAAHAAHHLVENQQRAVAVADVAHGAEITLRRRHAAGGGADHRLGDERRHRVGAEALEFGLQFGRQPRHEIRFGFIVALFMIGEGRRHMAEGVATAAAHRARGARRCRRRRARPAYCRDSSGGGR